MVPSPLIQTETEYTFEDYRESYIAQQRSMHPPTGWKSIVAWTIFLGVFGFFALLLYVGNKNAPAAPAPATPPGRSGADLVVRILFPLIPWVFILFLLWFFVLRSLGTRRPHRPLEQYIHARSLPNRGYFFWIIVLFSVVAIIPILSKSSAQADDLAWIDRLIDLSPYAVIFLVICLVMFRGLQKAQIRRLWIGQPMLHTRRRISFDNDGVLTEDALSRYFVRWVALLRFIETENLFLLMSSDFGYMIVTKRSLPDAGNDLRALLREKIVQRTAAFPVRVVPPPLPASVMQQSNP